MPKASHPKAPGESALPIFILYIVILIFPLWFLIFPKTPLPLEFRKSPHQNLVMSPDTSQGRPTIVA